MNQAYTEAVKEHTQEHIESLLELNKVLATRSLSFLERSAAERSVQVVVEACIGLSKHVCKKAEKQVLGDAKYVRPKSTVSLARAANQT